MIQLFIKNIATQKDIDLAALRARTHLPLATLQTYWQDEVASVNKDELACIASALGVDVSELSSLMSDKFVSQEGDIEWL